MKTFLATLPMDHPDKIEARRRVVAQIANGLRSKDDLAEWDALNEWKPEPEAVAPKRGKR